MSSKSKSVLVRMGAYSRVVVFQSSSDLAASSMKTLHLQIKDEHGVGSLWTWKIVKFQIEALVIAEVSNINLS